MSCSDRVAQLYPQAPGSLFVAFYYSQNYGGCILTRLHAGNKRFSVKNNVWRSEDEYVFIFGIKEFVHLRSVLADSNTLASKIAALQTGSNK
jgi:hypothetical protein